MVSWFYCIWACGEVAHYSGSVCWSGLKKRKGGVNVFLSALGAWLLMERPPIRVPLYCHGMRPSFLTQKPLPDAYSNHSISMHTVTQTHGWIGCDDHRLLQWLEGPRRLEEFLFCFCLLGNKCKLSVGTVEERAVTGSLCTCTTTWRAAIGSRFPTSLPADELWASSFVWLCFIVSKSQGGCSWSGCEVSAHEQEELKGVRSWQAGQIPVLLCSASLGPSLSSRKDPVLLWIRHNCGFF